MIGPLRSLTETCRPRPEVLKGGLSDNHFAAQLDKVVRDPDSYPVYGDATEFFALTYPTVGLRRLLSRTFGRLTGANVEGAQHGVIRSETSFGGGKTHGLIAVYHLAKGYRPLGLADFVDPGLLPDTCQIAAVVADTLDPIAGLETNGVRTHTMWGEIAAQLGPPAYEKMRVSDETRTAPSKTAWEDIIGDTPTVVIIDEIAQHLRQLASSGDPDVRRMAEAVPVFLKNLFELAAGNPHVVVIITLATRSDAFGRETDELSELLDTAAAEFRSAFNETLSIVARPTSGGSIVTPASDDEIGEILKRRLFANIDLAAAAEAGIAYQAYYEGLAAHGEQLGGGAEAPATYGSLITSSYPFHPELIRVLDKRIGTIPNFQRARGALKLLSDVVAGVWEERTDTEILNVADLDYDRDAVLSHLTIGIARPDFEGVAKADFAGPTSHARYVDNTRFAGRTPYATRACRTVFTHSLEMVSTAGAGRNDYLLGTLRVGDEPEIIGQALAAAEKVTWHLDYDGTRWRFTTEPNANKIIDEEAINVAHSLVSAEVEDRVRRAFPDDGLVKVVHFPSGPAGVRDEAQLRLAVMHHDDLTVRAGTATPPPDRLVSILDRYGVSEGIRTFRNSVAFLVADSNSVDAMRDQVRFDMAADRIVDDKTRMATFTPEVQKKLRAIADTAKLNARVALTRCYRHLYFPAADKANGNLRHEELAPKSTGDVEKAQTRVIVEALKEYGKVRTQAMSTDYLRQKAWPKTADEVTTEAVLEAFWADHGAQLVLDVTMLRDVVRDGVKNGSWVYYDAQAKRAYSDKDPAAPVDFNRDCLLYALAKATELGLLGRPVRFEDVDKAVRSGSTSGPALRTALEKEVGHEPTKAEILEVVARAAEGADNARLIVVVGELAPGAKAATPGEVRKVSLDSITLLTPEEADRKSIERPTVRRSAKAPVESRGPAGVAVQQLIDKASDAHDVTGFTAISVEATADPGEGVRDVSLLGKAIAMLPKFDIDVAVSLELDFKGMADGVEVSLTGPARDYQRVEDALLGFAKAASDIAGKLRLDIRFATPAPINGAEVQQLRKVLTDLQPGELKLKGVLA
jgi:hypothetical protein